MGIHLVSIFDSAQSFMPHGHCYMWEPALVWLNASTDTLIFMSYMAISATLAYVVLKMKEVPFLSLSVLFGVFIFACGITHILEVLNIWIPTYWTSGGVKAVTAIASVGTAIMLPLYLPKIREAVKGAALAEAQAAVKASEGGLIQLAETIPQIVWTAKADGNLDYYNQRWFDFTGMTFEQTKDWGWEPVLHPDDLKNCVDRWSHAVRTGELYEVEYRFKRAADGMYRWHLGRALPVKNSRGVIVKWFGTCTDIHDQKQAIEKTRLAEQKLSKFIASVPVILWATNEKGIVTLSEGTGLASIGLNPGETVGWDMLNSEKVGVDSRSDPRTDLGSHRPHSPGGCSANPGRSQRLRELRL